MKYTQARDPIGLGEFGARTRFGDQHTKGVLTALPEAVS